MVGSFDSNNLAAQAFGYRQLPLELQKQIIEEAKKQRIKPEKLKQLQDEFNESTYHTKKQSEYDFLSPRPFGD